MSVYWGDDADEIGRKLVKMLCHCRYAILNSLKTTRHKQPAIVVVATGCPAAQPFDDAYGLTQKEEEIRHEPDMVFGHVVCMELERLLSMIRVDSARQSIKKYAKHGVPLVVIGGNHIMSTYTVNLKRLLPEELATPYSRSRQASDN